LHLCGRDHRGRSGRGVGSGRIGGGAAAAFVGGRRLHSDGGNLRGGGFGLARAAVCGRRWLLLAVRGLLADESTLRFRAVRRTVALPVAHRLFAHRFADRLGVAALRVAQGILTDCVALRAAALLAVLDRAAHLALRLVALDLALGAAKLLASRRALGRLANGLANLVAHGGVALPLALWVAVVVLAAITVFVAAAGGAEVCRGGQRKSAKKQDGNSLHFSMYIYVEELRGGKSGVYVYVV